MAERKEDVHFESMGVIKRKSKLNKESIRNRSTSELPPFSSLKRDSREKSIDKVKQLRELALRSTAPCTVPPSTEKKSQQNDSGQFTLTMTQQGISSLPSSPRSASPSSPRKNKLPRRTTADNYEQLKTAFTREHWKSLRSLYGTELQTQTQNNTLSAFPNWHELPKGLDPQYAERLEGEQFVTANARARSEVLLIDSVGFEAELRHWITKTSNITLETLQENLQNPSEFSQFSVKSKVRKIDIQLDPNTPEIIVTSQKTGKITRIPFAQVNEIRVGPKTKGFEASRSQVIADSLAFTIVHGDKELNLMSKYPHKVQLWLGGLIIIIPLYKGDNTEFAYLSEHWREQGKKLLCPKEIGAILDKMKIKVQKKLVKEILQSHRRRQLRKNIPKGQYVLEDFISLIRTLRIPSEVTDVFNRLADRSRNVIMDKRVLQFLHEEQKETHITREDVKRLLKPYKEEGTENALTLEGFAKFMCSEFMNVFNPCMREIYQTMDRPLTDYFIYSSHNTYLEGNQLSGWSSSDMYIRVLKAGCRCVELDCWNGDSGEPIIFHGHTLTSRILFEDAVRAIRDYAFVSSDFPVILSLENHCNVDQQTRMAEIMVQYFKDNIARPIVGSDREYLPSPNELKGKIIIKGKVDKINMNADYSSEPEIKVRVAPELAAITYLTSTTFTSFEQFAENSKGCWEICSFVETKLEGLSIVDFIEFNKRNFSRIYPKGSRTMSSNYNPEPFWCGGSQLVALNLQTMGKIAWTNEGKFRDNGACGYVLKPFYMLHDYRATFDENNCIYTNPIRLTINVISARQLPRGKSEAMNPFVTAFIRGFKVDMKSFSTHKVKNNAFNPHWGKIMEFDIMSPENAVLLFIIYSETDTLKGLLSASRVVDSRTKLAYYSLPIGCIKQGYRVMELYSDDGSRIPMSDLFCHFKIEHLTESCK